MSASLPKGLTDAERFVRHSAGNTPTGEPCPDCGGPIEYNGNYFCIDCPWAMPVAERPPWRKSALEKRCIAGVANARLTRQKSQVS